MKLSVWMDKKFGNDTDTLKQTLDDLRECGINRILYNAPIREIENFLKHAADMEVRIWKIMLLNNDEDLIKNHPDWFIINKLGNCSITHPAYVNYYKWLCPNHPEVYGFLENSIKKLCEITELKGIHLDYIRFPDVILPKGIQPLYNLVQTAEEPQYDYCYCEHCQKKFKEITGFDPYKDDNSMEWKQFRYDSITEIVNKLSIFIHSYKKEISAAVFPTPNLAKKLVRQEWAKWELDEVYPMIYHTHYEKPIEWISEAIKQGANKTIAKLHAGVFLPAFSGVELQQAIEIYKNSKADGLSLFNAGTINKEHRKILNKLVTI